MLVGKSGLGFAIAQSIHTVWFIRDTFIRDIWDLSKKLRDRA